MLIAACCFTMAFAPPTLLPTQLSTRCPQIRLMADDDDGDVFAAFSKAVKGQRPNKPGEGERTREAAFPVRLGGSTRDGSLGDLRAATNTLKTLSNPRDWQAEEFGIIAAIVSIFAGYQFFYQSYVADAPPEAAPSAGKASQALSRAMAECTDQACMDRVQKELGEAVIVERQLDDCIDKAFSNTERNICKQKFGGASTPFGF